LLQGIRPFWSIARSNDALAKFIRAWQRLPHTIRILPVMTKTTDPLSRLLAIMARLRDPDGGCEWDLAQNFGTIAPYTIEEAYEVADAIARGDMAALREELGDLLLQVVFHSRMAQEAGHFAFADVAQAISDKMEARHPHIFGGADEAGQSREERWENAKAAERSAKGAESALDGVAMALPALMRAEKLQKRAARVGFDWPDVAGPAAKLVEETAELAEAITPSHRFEEAGDLLFAAANLVRAYGIAPEDALAKANAKFERRFRAMETLAGGSLSGHDLDAQEALWQSVKAAE
jgi:ATP diphosphatase